MEIPIKMDDLGVPVFLETPISISFSGVYRQDTTKMTLSYFDGFLLAQQQRQLKPSYTRHHDQQYLLRSNCQHVASKDSQPVNCETNKSWKQMGISKNRGTPKWMVYNGNPYK